MCACTLAAQSQPNTKTISVEVTNSWSKDKSDAPVVLKIKDLQPGFRVRSAVVMNGSEEIPSQLDDLNGDLKADELAFVMDIPARSKKRWQLPCLLPKQTRPIRHVYLPKC